MRLGRLTDRLAANYQDLSIKDGSPAESQKPLNVPDARNRW